MGDETTILPAHEAAATLRREIAVLEQEIAALETDYTRRLEALNQQPTKVRQMQISFGLFILGTILFVTVNQILALVAIAIAVGLAWDSRRHDQRFTAEKMAVYSEGEEIWEEKQELLTEKRAALDDLLAVSG